MKKFTISSDALKPALKKLGLVVNEKTILPATKNIFCKVSKSEVEFIATDIETYISYKCPAESNGAEDFEMMIPFDFINRIMPNYKGIPIVVELISVKKGRIICDKDVYEINSLEKTDSFPVIPSAPKKSMHTLSDQFVAILTKALLTCSKDNLRPVMQRVCLDMKPGEVNIVSTDTHCLYKKTLPLEVTDPIQLQFSANTIKALEGMEQVEISWTAKKICIKSDIFTVWTTRHEDKYPDYRVVIPSNEANLSVNKKDLVEALSKSLISKISTHQTDILPLKDKGYLSFETNDPEYERKIHVQIAGLYEGSVEKICINAKKLLTIMDQVEGDEIKLHLHSPTKAMLISSVDDKDYIGLIMPLIF